MEDQVNSFAGSTCRTSYAVSIAARENILYYSSCVAAVVNNIKTVLRSTCLCIIGRPMRQVSLVRIFCMTAFMTIHAVSLLS